MPISETQKPYKLSRERNNEIYQVLQEHLFSGKTSPFQKVALFTAGQPGSGKTSLRQTLYSQYPKKGVIEINTDDLRNYHPDYEKLQKDPVNYKRAGFLVNPDSIEWASRASQQAISKGYSLLYDMTFAGNVETYLGMLKQHRDQGYRNELHVLAVNPDISRLGTHLRYENQVKDKGFGRAVSMVSHDANFNNLSKNIQVAVDSGLIDQVAIYGRKIHRDQSGEIRNNALSLLYNSAGDKVDSKTIISKIKEEQQRPYTNLEKEYLNMRMDQVKGMIQERKGDVKEFLTNMKELTHKLNPEKGRGFSL